MPVFVKGRVPYCAHQPIHNKKIVYLFTANSYIKKDGKLTMGRGCALAVKQIFPNIDSCFKVKHLTMFGCKFAKVMNRFGVTQRLGAFQTKVHFKDASSIEAIAKATRQLALRAKITPSYTYLLPLPGSDLGRLAPEKVIPLLKDLPDNVHIYIDDKDWDTELVTNLK